MDTELTRTSCSFRIAVVAHEERRTAAVRLVDQVGALGANFDDGTLTCEGNHRTVWNWHAGCGDCHDWAVVLEDDAAPVAGFRDQLTAALAVAPAPIVSLYLGTSRPPSWQNRVREATTRADKAEACYITAPRLLHAVGVAIRTDSIADMLEHLDRIPALPIDQAISNWAKRRNHPVAYTWPSLADHTDGPTLVRHPDGAPRNKPRRAWRTGTRDQWNRTTVVPM